VDIVTKASEPTAGGEVGIAFRWPPPGLERMQGDLAVIASRAALGGGLLVLPLLLVVAGEPGLATLGPFADAWWVPLTLALVGLAFSIDALVLSARTMRRASRALKGGYDAVTVGRVLADSGRDMGFLLQGARHFSVIKDDERLGIAAIRVAALSLIALAGLWLSTAVCIGLFFAARGLISPRGLQAFTLLPAFVAYACGAVASIVMQGRVRRARKVWHKQPWSQDLAGDEVHRWTAAYPFREGTLRALDDVGVAQGLGRAAFIVGALGVVVALPVMTLVPAAAVAPILTAISMPTFDSYRPRAARSEAFRSYVAGADLSITPAQAGQILHDLVHVGSDIELTAGERSPSRAFSQPWIPVDGEGNNPLDLDPYAWGDSLLERVSELNAEQRAYLAEVASHPASPDFSRLARASRLDAGSARWENPLPTTMTMATLPLPRLGLVRSAGNAHIAAAANQLAQGNADAAERLLAEVVSVGFLLADDGPTLIDNLVGVGLITSGGAALEDLFRATGRSGASAELSRLTAVAERSVALMRSDLPKGTEAWVRSLPAMVLDDSTVRGLRWEYFITFATVAPCLNMHRMVFGADDEYETFVEEARASLVQWPSEEAVFEIAQHGWTGAAEHASPPWFTRLAGLYMSDEEHSCRDLVSHMGANDF